MLCVRAPPAGSERRGGGRRLETDVEPTAAEVTGMAGCCAKLPRRAEKPTPGAAIDDDDDDKDGADEGTAAGAGVCCDGGTDGAVAECAAETELFRRAALLCMMRDTEASKSGSPAATAEREASAASAPA